MALLRLTKVLSSSNRLLIEWRLRSKQNTKISTFDDLVLAPVSIKFVVNLLKKIISKRYVGIYHSSGDREITYTTFAQKYLNALGLKTSSITPCLQQKNTQKDAFKLQHASLDCVGNPNNLRGSQKFENVLYDICATA